MINRLLKTISVFITIFTCPATILIMSIIWILTGKLHPINTIEKYFKWLESD